MLAARGQENLVGRHQNGNTLKPKTPGAKFPNTPRRIPLNDENATQIRGGTIKDLKPQGTQKRGNENARMPLSTKGTRKVGIATPMGPQTSRAPLGAKTTNAKATAASKVNVKNAVQEIEKSQQTQKPVQQSQKKRQAKLQTPKLKVHPEDTAPQPPSPDEYCPPAPKSLSPRFSPYRVPAFSPSKVPTNITGRSDFFAGCNLPGSPNATGAGADHAITSDATGFEWSIPDDLATDVEEEKQLGAGALSPTKQLHKRPAVSRGPLSTASSRQVANALSMDDTTRSVRRRVGKVSSTKSQPHKKATPLALPSFKPSRPIASGARNTLSASLAPGRNIEASSRTTIGYNKGRATSSILAQRAGSSGPIRTQQPLVRTNTSMSTGSDRTITPARLADQQASTVSEDQEWKERVPFLSIFSPNENDEELDIAPGGGVFDIGMGEEEEPELLIL